MSEQLLTILKLCLLALLYLFFFRVVRAVWAELRSAQAAPAGAAPAPARPVAAPQPAAAPPKRKAARGVPTELVATDPPERRGATFPIGTELTVGRAGGCAISLPDDTYVSNLHARVFTSNGRVLVEDLGSTNGTFLNREKLTSTVPLNRGDRLQVGSTVLEAK
jgi:pSer/pThr/pTyr-binding forkhead associated (FHA) protein